MIGGGEFESSGRKQDDQGLRKGAQEKKKLAGGNRRKRQIEWKLN